MKQVYCPERELLLVPEAEVRTVSEKEGLFYIGVHLLSEENVQHKKKNTMFARAFLLQPVDLPDQSLDVMAAVIHLQSDLDTG